MDDATASTPPQGRPRQFAIVDLMILTAATALLMRMSLGYPERLIWRIGQCRDLLAYELLPDQPYPRDYIGHGLGHSRVRRIVAVNVWFIFAEGLMRLLVAFTPALLLIRLRRPRPEWRALMRQPGFVAEVAAVVGFWSFWYGGYFGVPVPGLLVLPGSAVFVAWIIQVASGLREREAGWVDRTGRVIGYGWIVLAVGRPLEYLWIWR